MKARNVINTRRPMQGLGAFVRVAAGLTSVADRSHGCAQGSFVPASLCLALGWLDRAEDQVHPGEGSA